MISTQVNNVFCPKVHAINRYNVKGLHPLPPVPVAFVRCPPLKFPAPLKISTNSVKCKQSMPVCLSGGGARAGDGNQEPLWKSFGKAIENFGKKSSVEDLLKQQIQKREFYEEGGNPPGGSGGGGSGGGGGGFGDLGGSEEEGFSGILDETVQVVLATFGFIFLYLYIINGAEMALLFKDYIKYVFRGKKSIRLSRALYVWEQFFKNPTESKETDRYWLEKAIIRTPTWWDSPEKYKRILQAYTQTPSNSSMDNEREQEEQDQYQEQYQYQDHTFNDDQDDSMSEEF